MEWQFLSGRCEMMEFTGPIGGQFTCVSTFYTGQCRAAPFSRRRHQLYPREQHDDTAPSKHCGHLSRPEPVEGRPRDERDKQTMTQTNKTPVEKLETFSQLSHRPGWKERETRICRWAHCFRLISSSDCDLAQARHLAISANLSIGAPNWSGLGLDLE